MRIDDLEVYRLAMKIGEEVWQIASSWAYFEKNTLGRQFVRAADSIAANLSEGYGRFSYNENRQFVYYARGSLYETGTWLHKARHRNLVGKETFEALSATINTTAKMINGYLRSIGKGGKPVNSHSSLVIGKGKEIAAATQNPHEANARNGFQNDQ
jgi:four helix bundle protein